MRDDPRQIESADPRDAEIARRHGVPVDAVAHLRAAMKRGGGTMAQFDHPGLGGPGQWMAGGLTMVAGGLRDHAGAARVDALCQAVAASTAWLPEPVTAPAVVSSGTGAGTGALRGRVLTAASAAPTAPAARAPSCDDHPSDPVMSAMPTFPPLGPMTPMSEMAAMRPFVVPRWWPAELGDPASTGAQDGMRYAHFAELERLAVESAGAVVVFDTGGRQVMGFGQQQPGRPSIRVDGPDGVIDVAALPVVLRARAEPPA